MLRMDEDIKNSDINIYKEFIQMESSTSKIKCKENNKGMNKNFEYTKELEARIICFYLMISVLIMKKN